MVTDEENRACAHESLNRVLGRKEPAILFRIDYLLQLEKRVRLFTRRHRASVGHGLAVVQRGLGVEAFILEGQRRPVGESARARGLQLTPAAAVDTLRSP